MFISLFSPQFLQLPLTRRTKIYNVRFSQFPRLTMPFLSNDRYIGRYIALRHVVIHRRCIYRLSRNHACTHDTKLEHDTKMDTRLTRYVPYVHTCPSTKAFAIIQRRVGCTDSCHEAHVTVEV